MQMPQGSPSSTDSLLSAVRIDPVNVLGITQCRESKMLFDHCQSSSFPFLLYEVLVLVYVVELILTGFKISRH